MASTEPIETAFLAYRRSRDPKALAAVYDGTVTRLLAIAMHLCRDASDAEDAVQETFLLALERPFEWDSSRPLMPWLLGILSNRVRRARASQSRRTDPDRVTLWHIEDPQNELAASEELARIDQAIKRLAQPYQAVVLLRLRSGMSTVDIAISLNRKPSTVRAQLARGLEMLRKALPVGAMALLTGALSASVRAGTVRDHVLGRAHEIQSGFRMQQRMAQLRHWALGGLGCAAAALVTWMVWPGSATPRSTVQGPGAEVATTVFVETIEERLPSPAATTLENRRTAVATTGALEVSITRNGTGLPGTAVELEPISDPPIVFTNTYSVPRGGWREIVAGRPCAAIMRRNGSTQPTGQATFTDLAPGYWICRALDAVELVEIRPGVRTTLELPVDPRAIVVHGLVLERDGRPAAEAAVWRCDELRGGPSHTFAYTDDHGCFVAVVRPFTTIGASRAGSAPVALTLTPKTAAPNLEIVLRLVGEGARLTGQVVDATGEPVAGAAVEVGHPTDAHVVAIAIPQQPLARPERTVTDARGVFRFDSLAPGETVLLVHHPDHGARRRVADLQTGVTATVDLALPAAVTLSGQVRDARGDPVPHAEVRVGRRGLLGHRSTVTDANGRYRLTGLTPGRPMVEVSKHGGGFAYCELACEPGETVTWSPVVSKANLCLSGRVVDTRGQPFAHGWIVHNRRWNVSVYQLDAEGRFSAPLSERVAALPSGLHVHARDPRGAGGKVVGSPVAIAPGLRAGTEDLEIVVPDPLTANARVRGQLVTASGSPSRGRWTLLGSSDGRVWSWRHDVEAVGADGSFAVEAILPGTYLLRSEAAGGRSIGPFELAPGADHDLGVVQIVPRAADAPRFRRHLALLFPGSVAATEAVKLVARDEQGWIVASKLRSASLDGKPTLYVNLPAGRFDLTATSRSGMVARRRVVVDPKPPQRALLLVFEPQ